MKEQTMRYRPDRFEGATPSQKKPVYFYKVFEGDEVDSCLDDGWYIHPDDFPRKAEKKTAVKKGK